MKRKLFFALEGTDGTGKSTVLSLAHKARNGDFAALKCPPDEIARFRAFYDAEDFHPGARMFFYLSANLYLSRVIRDMTLRSPVCCDRFILSTFANHNSGAKPEYDFRRLADLFLREGGVLPDSTILLVAEEEERARRIGMKTTITERDLMLHAASKAQERMLKIACAAGCLFKVHIIDTTRLSLEDTVARVARIIGEVPG